MKFKLEQVKRTWFYLIVVVAAAGMAGTAAGILKYHALQLTHHGEYFGHLRAEYFPCTLPPPCNEWHDPDMCCVVQPTYYYDHDSKGGPT